VGGKSTTAVEGDDNEGHAACVDAGLTMLRNLNNVLEAAGGPGMLESL
jgi:hypothetical protein